MSIHIIGEVWDHSRSSGTARLVLLALADNADRQTRLAWPSVRELARRTRVSERSVQRSLRVLEGLAEIELVEAGGPPARPARYRVAPEGRQADTATAQRGDAGDEEGRHHGSGVVPAVSPEPSVEPLREPSGSSSARELTSEEELPRDFPDRLRPPLEVVWPIIERVARAKPRSVAPTRGSVARALASFPDRDHIDAASDLEQWLVHGTGRKTPVADVVQSFRRALARGQAQEPLGDRPKPDRGGQTQRQRNLSRYDEVMHR